LVDFELTRTRTRNSNSTILSPQSTQTAHQSAAATRRQVAWNDQIGHFSSWFRWKNR